MKPAVWVGFAIIAGALAFGARAFVTNLTPYVTFEQARAAKGSVQVMGKLDKKSIGSDGTTLDFTLLDDEGRRMPVRFAGARPANFEEAVQVTAIGSYDGATLQANNLLVKCPSKYQGTETKQYGASPDVGKASPPPGGLEAALKGAQTR
jgi:cytochrome c-type biogenesis protein CcmE